MQTLKIQALLNENPAQVRYQIGFSRNIVRLGPDGEKTYSIGISRTSSNMKSPGPKSQKQDQPGYTICDCMVITFALQLKK